MEFIKDHSIEIIVLGWFALMGLISFLLAQSYVKGFAHFRHTYKT